MSDIDDRAHNYADEVYDDMAAAEYANEIANWDRWMRSRVAFADYRTVARELEDVYSGRIDDLDQRVRAILALRDEPPRRGPGGT